MAESKFKKYLRDEIAIKAVDRKHLWRYYIAREYFLALPIEENGETLASIEELAGVAVEPIWEDAEPDEEGLAYRLYLENNSLAGWMRRSTAKNLLSASHALKTQGLTLVLKAGFRPLEVQRQLFAEVYAAFASEHPHLSKTELLNLTRDFVSDPSQIVPPHTAGAAVDVKLRDANGIDVDMGGALNDSSDLAWAACSDITKAQAGNRKVLRDAMLAAGFAPLGSEWWHFSYGDQLWAAYYGKPAALYGIVS